jgi:glycosyltransferase involved in cell wall biosynthesis
VVVIPAYRAASSIEKVLRAIPAWVEAIYVVDDASPDDTGARARAVGDPRVDVLVHDANRGGGSSMVTGYTYALRRGMDICVKMDTDDQMDASLLPALIDPNRRLSSTMTGGSSPRVPITSQPPTSPLTT